jgi:hypothetical protein
MAFSGELPVNTQSRSQISKHFLLLYSLVELNFSAGSLVLARSILYSILIWSVSSRRPEENQERCSCRHQSKEIERLSKLVVASSSGLRVLPK